MLTDTAVRFRLISLVFGVAAISYLLSMPLQPYALSFLHKALPIAALALLLVCKPVFSPKLAFAALGFSALGDILLALPLQNGFVFGLSAFLIAHLCYLSWFWRARPGKPAMRLVHWLVLAAGGAMAWLVLPHTGQLQLPVALYMTVIIAMTLSAIAADDCKHLLTLGAGVFMFSDALIAVNRFVAPVAHADVLIMTSYYLAQLCLVLGILRVSRRHADAR